MLTGRRLGHQTPRPYGSPGGSPLGPMAHCRIGTLAGSPAQVFDATLEAVAQLGYQVSIADRAAGHLYLSKPRGQRGSSRRFGLVVTDSGLGHVVVLISWDPSPLLPWPLRWESRNAGRLCRRIEQTLESRQSPTHS